MLAIAAIRWKARRFRAVHSGIARAFTPHNVEGFCQRIFGIQAAVLIPILRRQTSVTKSSLPPLASIAFNRVAQFGSLLLRMRLPVAGRTCDAIAMRLMALLHVHSQRTQAGATILGRRQHQREVAAQAIHCCINRHALTGRAANNRSAVFQDRPAIGMPYQPDRSIDC